MLLDCREPALLLWVIVLKLAVFFPKVCVLFLRTFSGSVSADASLQPLSGAKQCSFFTAMFHPVLEGAVLFVGFVAVYVVHPSLDAEWVVVAEWATVDKGLQPHL